MKYPSRSRIPKTIKKMEYPGKLSVNGTGKGSISKNEVKTIKKILKRFTALFLVNIKKRGLIYFSTFPKAVIVPFNIFKRVFFGRVYSMINLGIKYLLKILLIPINIIPSPKGMLDPGIDTGIKKGVAKIKQMINPPRSPINSRKSLMVIPSSGILEDISSSDIEKHSLDLVSDNWNHQKIIFLIRLYSQFKLNHLNRVLIFIIFDLNSYFLFKIQLLINNASKRI